MRLIHIKLSLIHIFLGLDGYAPQWTDEELESFPDGFIAVSYTHLDVYKRQF